MKATESAVDIVSKNSHENVSSEVLGKVCLPTWDLLIFRTKIFPRFSEHTETGTVKRFSVKKKCS